MKKKKKSEGCIVLKRAKGKALYAILLGLFVVTSCAEDPVQPAPPVSGDTYTLLFKSSKAIELKQKQADQEVLNIPLEDSANYFGKRMQVSCPGELQFKNDSLSIVKMNGVIEKFMIKWQGNELYLHNDLSKTWEYSGEKEGKRFILNTGFYIRKCQNDQRSLTFVGQEYCLRTFAELADYIGKNANESLQETIWLKMEYSFE